VALASERNGSHEQGRENGSGVGLMDYAEELHMTKKDKKLNNTMSKRNGKRTK